VPSPSNREIEQASRQRINFVDINVMSLTRLSAMGNIIRLVNPILASSSVRLLSDIPV
jgi:hypothetical protein